MNESDPRIRPERPSARGIGERALNLWDTATLQRTRYRRKKPRRIEVYDAHDRRFYEQDATISYLGVFGRAVGVIALIGFVTNPSETTRDATALLSGGLWNGAESAGDLFTRSAEGGREGLQETAPGLVDDMSGRIENAGEALAGGNQSPSDQSSTLPSDVDDILGSEDPSTTTIYVTPEPETTQPSNQETARQTVIGSLICVGEPVNLTVGDYGSPSQAIAAVNPEIEGNWAAISQIVDYVYGLEANANLPTPEASRPETTINSVPSDCVEP